MHVARALKVSTVLGGAELAELECIVYCVQTCQGRRSFQVLRVSSSSTIVANRPSSGIPESEVSTIV